MMEQHITRVSEAPEEAGGRGCDHGPSVALMNRLQHSVNGLGLARAASTVHSLRAHQRPIRFPQGKVTPACHARRVEHMNERQIGTTLKVRNDDHVRGANTAPVTVLVYGDYECPYTRELEVSVARLRHLDNASFRYVFRPFPLRDIHPHAEMAAEAAEAVASLAGPDAFWVMHDALFANQDDLGLPNLERQATAAGVDSSTFRDALKTHRFAKRVERYVRSGRANGVGGTPSVFINGERYLGGRDVATLREAVARSSKQ
jgi:protein-disulfide isomerase